jgi:hypothetical protein
VTIPPLQISNNVATHVNHVKRFSHIPDLAGDVWIISFFSITIQLTADYADNTDLINKGSAILGNARVSRVGERVLAIANFPKITPSNKSPLRRDTATNTRDACVT